MTTITEEEARKLDECLALVDLGPHIGQEWLRVHYASADCDISSDCYGGKHYHVTHEGWTTEHGEHITHDLESVIIEFALAVPDPTENA